MHTSSRCRIYLSAETRPIIESSHSLIFSPFPPGMSRQPTGTGEDIQVTDFDHAGAGVSPSWRFLEDTLRDDDIEALDQISVADALRLYLVPFGDPP